MILRYLSQAKNKSWLGIRECFRTLDGSWTYLAESSNHAQKLLGAGQGEEDVKDLTVKLRRCLESKVSTTVGLVFESERPLGLLSQELKPQPAAKKRKLGPGRGAEDDPADGGGDNQEEAQAKSARKLFDLLRARYANTAAFAAALLQQRSLQKDMRVIYDVTGPLHEEYTSYLDAHTAGYEALLQESSQRSLAKWFVTVAKTMDLLTDTALIQRLELTPRPLGRHVLAVDSPTVAEDVRITCRLFEFVVELSANRMWSQAHHGLVFPYVFACAAVDGERDRARAQSLLRGIAKAWLKLKDQVCREPQGPCADLWADLGTARWQVVREILVQGEGCGWDLGNPELQDLCKALFGGPLSMKDILESTFASLRDSIRQCKNSSMSQWTRFCYLICSPYGRHDGGVPLFRPERGDFSLLYKNGFDDTEILSLNLWSPARTPFSNDLPSSQKIDKIRPAGFHAN